ncbi:MAG: DUF3313 family protein [Betaproteobacteria bacterium]
MGGNRWPRVVALLAFCCLASAASGQESQSPDRLVQIKSRQMEMAWLLPGVDFRTYTKVNISRTQVAFRQDWMKDYNLNAQLGNWISQEQADKIMASAQTNFDDIFRDAFQKAGYEVVTTTGPDVLRVNSSILDLNVNAPLGQSTGQMPWIINAGDAALIVEVRDTVTNAILGRVADRRATRDVGRQMATIATNVYDFRLLFAHWSGICVKALAELKSLSPVPKVLTPNQSL